MQDDVFKTEQRPPRQDDPCKKLLKIILSGVPIGFLFGMAFDKAKVNVPKTITDTFLFKNAIMMKMFLAATAVGLLIIAALETLGVAKRVSKGPRAFGLGLMKGYGLNVIGGLLLGAGMVLCGSCPGTVFAQIGAGVPNAWFTLLGGFIGVLLFGIIHKVLRGVLPDFERCGEKRSVDGMLGWTYMRAAGVFAAALAAVVLLLELLVPWKDDVERVFNLPVGGYIMWGGDPTALAWSPVAAGILIGLLQLFAMLSNKTPLGMSSGYVTVMGYLLSPIPDVDVVLPAFKGFKGVSHLWQVFVAIGVGLGAFASSKLSDATSSMLPESPSVALAICGGALQLLGARLAGGCTSGHGISGMAQLSLPSIVTVCCMFAAAITTAWLAFGI